MFSYFESSVDGIIPNEYTSLENIYHDFVGYLVRAKDYTILIVRQCYGAQQQYVSTDFLRKISDLKFKSIVEETTATMAANVTVAPTLLTSQPPQSHELTLDTTKNTTATMHTNKQHQNNEFANNLDNHLRRFDKRLITDADRFVLNYRGEANKKVIWILGLGIQSILNIWNYAITIDHKFYMISQLGGWCDCKNTKSTNLLDEPNEN